MTRKAREIETLLLAMFAALPLYVTGAVGRPPLILFHAAMAVIVLRVLSGRGPDLLPAGVMRWLAVAYVPFYLIDAAILSRSAIAASTHLVLFIAVYQPIEAMQRDNQGQRLLTAALIFLASLATSTHITIVLFVIAFAFLAFRQLMYVSHLETVRSIDGSYAEAPSARAAVFYLVGAVVIGAALFPMLPRMRNPFVQGVTGGLPNAATGLSETINFNEPRMTLPGNAVVARIWMDRQARPFFTPVRLRGTIYDRYVGGEWRQTVSGLRERPSRGGTAIIARGRGVERQATIQQRPQAGKIYLPPETYAVSGLSGRLYEGPSRETYHTYEHGMLNLTVSMATLSEPLRLPQIPELDYPISPEVRELAKAIVGDEQRRDFRAVRIEQYLLRNFRYLADPADIGRTMSIDDFLLRERRGHCEYFAAGMVVLLAAVDVPARIAGGFYGGRMNPLTGYYTIRRDDAHAWTEVWDGTRWLTYDSTPASLRPGTSGESAILEYLAAVADSLTFIWDRYVLTFGFADQVALFTDLMTWARDAALSAAGRVSGGAQVLSSLSLVIVIVAVAFVGLLIMLLARRRRPLFDVLARYLAARGIEVGPGMTMEDALRELRVNHPDEARELEPLIAMYEEERFSSRRDPRRASAIRRRVAELSDPLSS